jgi:hypothetical protein
LEKIMSKVTEVVKIYERRIANAYEARDRCKDGSWGYEYWTKVAAYLLRNLNRYIHLDVDTKTKEGQEHVVYNYH